MKHLHLVGFARPIVIQRPEISFLVLFLIFSINYDRNPLLVVRATTVVVKGTELSPRSGGTPEPLAKPPSLAG